MINRKTNQLILEIPKTGSRALVQAAIEAYDSVDFDHQGHSTLTELLERCYPNVGELERPLDVVGVIRNPRDRFRSQIVNYMKIKSTGLKQAMINCINQSHIIFKPQKAFVEIPAGYAHWVELRLFRDHAAAQAAVAGTAIVKKPIVKNVTSSSMRVEDFYEILDADLVNEAYEMFADDWSVYHRDTLVPLSEGK